MNTNLNLEWRKAVIGKNPRGKWVYGWELTLLDERGLDTVHRVSAKTKPEALRTMKADIARHEPLADIVIDVPAGATTFTLRHDYGGWQYQIIRDGKVRCTTFMGEEPFAEILAAVQRHASDYEQVAA